MIDAPLAYAFGVGMVATFNPCGFAMLPAYLSFFLGLEGARDEGARGSPLRALAVGATMTAGFLVVFGTLGILLEPLLDTIQEKLPWVTIVLGLGLVGLGIALLAGKSLSVDALKISRGADSRELWSVFVFGISYALVSLSCTLPTFFAAVAGVFDTENFVSGVAVFIAYGLGMGLVLMVLTLAIALAQKGLVTNLKRALPYVNRISGALLVVAGAYVAYYGWYELRVREGDTSGGAVADFVFDLNTRISTFIQDAGPVRIGLLLATIVLASITIALSRRSGTPVD